MNQIETITEQLASATPEQLAAIMAILNPAAVKKQTLRIAINESKKSADVAAINIDAVKSQTSDEKESVTRRLRRLQAKQNKTVKQQLAYAKLQQLAKEYAIAI